MVGKIIAGIGAGISLLMLYVATAPFEGMGDTGNFVYQLGGWTSRSIQCALLAFWIGKVSNRNIGKFVYAVLILTWTGFYSSQHYTQGMKVKAFLEETTALIEEEDTGKDLERLGQLAPVFKQFKSMRQSTDRIFEELYDKREQLNLADSILPEFLLELHGRNIARNKLSLFSESIDAFEREQVIHREKTVNLIKELKECNREFGGEFELGYQDQSNVIYHLIKEKVKFMRNSVRIVGKLIDFYESNHQEFFIQDTELYALKDETIDELDFIVYQLDFNENKEEEVNEKLIKFAEDAFSNSKEYN